MFSYLCPLMLALYLGTLVLGECILTFIMFCVIDPLLLNNDDPSLLIGFGLRSVLSNVSIAMRARGC